MFTLFYFRLDSECEAGGMETRKETLPLCPFTLRSYFIQKPFTQTTLFLHVYAIYFNHSKQQELLHKNAYKIFFIILELIRIYQLSSLLKYFFPEGVSSPGWCVFSFTSFLRLRGRVDSCPCFSLNQDVFHPITSAFLKIPPAKSPPWTKTAGLSNWERP